MIRVITGVAACSARSVTGCTTKQRDELAPPQLTELHQLPLARESVTA
jgi:hypothetical protein